MSKARWAALVVACAIAVAVGAWLVWRRPPAPPHALERQFYVWQRAWIPEVKQAISRAQDCADGFMVLAGEFECRPERVSLNAAPVDWMFLGEVARPVTLVFRARVALDERLDPAGLEATTGVLSETIEERVAEARKAGVTVAGIQLDYDCATQKLGRYRSLVDALERRHPDRPFSITVLPTWLARDEFAALVKPLAYFVLQVHSFEPPGTIRDPIEICRVERVDGYIKQASAARVPFYLALPTYGYQIAFDAQGRFIGLGAETHSGAWPPGYQIREAMADPTQLAPLVARLTQAPPPRMRGIIWFRLPVDTDTYNWSWPTLLAVMDGTAPQSQCTAEIRAPEPGLYEVWIANPPDSGYRGRVRVAVRVATKDVAAYDGLRGFTVQSTEPGYTLIGEAPAPGRSITAAWIRMAPGVGAGDVAINTVEELQ